MQVDCHFLSPLDRINRPRDWKQLAHSWQQMGTLGNSCSLYGSARFDVAGRPNTPRSPWSFLERLRAYWCGLFEQFQPRKYEKLNSSALAVLTKTLTNAPFCSLPSAPKPKKTKKSPCFRGVSHECSILPRANFPRRRGATGRTDLGSCYHKRRCFAETRVP